MAAASARILNVVDGPSVIEARWPTQVSAGEGLPAARSMETLEAAGRHPPDPLLFGPPLPDVSSLTFLNAPTRCVAPLHVIRITGHGAEDVPITAFRGSAQTPLKKRTGPGKP